MSGELEAAGAMATAGLAAAVIEGREGGKPGEGKCLNCGADLQGAFCHACGQHAHAHRTLGHFFAEFIRGLLQFDTKAWRTLPMLFGRPGTLTRNYIYGKRARYISPLALFLFCVFFMFAMFAFSGAQMEDGINAATSNTRAELLEEISDAQDDIRDEEQALAAKLANPDPDMPAGLEERLARMEVRLAQEELTRDQAALTQFDQRVAAAASGTLEEGVTVSTNEAGETVVTEASGSEGNRTWQQQVSEAAVKGEFVQMPGFPEIERRMNQQLENPDLALYKIQEAASKFSFLLVPISLPFIALLFLWKRGITFYDHAVYSLYALSFASLLFVLVLQLTRVPWLVPVIPFLLLIGLPVHTFFHMGGAYALGWWSALWRTCFMLIFAMFALCFWLVAIFILGLAG